jgi:hypothetical protein
MEYRGSFLGDKEVEFDANRSPYLEVKNAWRYMSIPPYVCTAKSFAKY